MEGVALNGLFGGVYAGKRVLVTGHTGFKGSWLCLWLQALGAEVFGIALPAATLPAHWTLLRLDGIGDVNVDVRDADAVRTAVADARPHVVFHLAAQALVRRSYVAPVETFATNVTGLVNVLEGIRTCVSVRAFVNATTDKVYAEHSAGNAYGEDDPLGGHDPYSTSKACAELITDCYRKSFLQAAGVRVATARAGNVIGGGDWSEDRLVPDLVRAAVNSQPLALRNPDAVRPWQHVLEPLSGYLRLGQALLAGEPVEAAWNFGPTTDATIPVAELVAAMQQHWPGIDVQRSGGANPHEAATLRLDCTRAARVLAWRPVWDASTTIRRTLDWYREHAETGALRTHADLAAYVADASTAGLGWTQSA